VTLEVFKLRNKLTYVSRINTLGELAASLAHEINQPLAAIRSNAEAIQSMLAAEGPDFDEIKAAVADIVSDDVRAGKTIRRLRALFRREELDRTELDLGELLTEVSWIIRSVGNAEAQSCFVFQEVGGAFGPSSQKTPRVKAKYRGLRMAIFAERFLNIDGLRLAPRKAAQQCSHQKQGDNSRTNSRLPSPRIPRCGAALLIPHRRIAQTMSGNHGSSAGSEDAERDPIERLPAILQFLYAQAGQAGDFRREIFLLLVSSLWFHASFLPADTYIVLAVPLRR